MTKLVFKSLSLHSYGSNRRKNHHFLHPHVFMIKKRDLNPKNKSKSVSKSAFNNIKITQKI